MKRLLCFIAALSVAVCFTLPCAADVSNEYDSSLYQSRAEALNALGIMSDEMCALSFDKGITYRDFIGMIASITGVSGETAGYMGLTEDNMYRYIDYDSAAKILVNLLGYSNSKDGTNYLKTVQRLDVDSCVVNKNADFALYDAVIMLYNALKTEVMEQVTYGDKIKFEKTSKTLSEQYKNAVYFEGRLAANKYTSMTDERESEDGRVLIDDYEKGVVSVKDGGKDTYNLIGRCVEGFYSGRKAGADNSSIISICPSVKNRELRLDYTNKPSFDASSMKIKYFDGKKEKSEKLAYDTELVYNGQVVKSGISEILNMINDPGDLILGDIIFINGGGGSGWDCLSISAYRNIVVQSVSRTEFKLSGRDNTFASYEEQSIKGLACITDAEGTKLNLQDVKKDDTLSIYEGLYDDKPVRITVSVSKINGRVKSLNTSAGEPTAVIDVSSAEDEKASESEFTFADPNLLNKLTVGESFVFNIDNSGRIAYVRLGEDTAEYKGLFVKLAEKDGLGGGIELLMLPEIDTQPSPEAAVVKLSENAKYDGAKISADNMGEINKKLFHTIIKYTANSKGEITRITEADNGSNDSMYSRNRPAALSDENEKPNIRELTFLRTQFAMFAIDDASLRGGAAYTPITFARYTESGRLNVLNNLKVICVPDVSLAEAGLQYADDFYRLLDLNKYEYFSLETPGKIKVTAYYDEEESVPSYLVYSASTALKPSTYQQLTYRDCILLVNSVSTVINPYNGLECLKISGMYAGQETTFYCKYKGILDFNNEGAYIDAGEGDVLHVMFDANGLITYGLRLYDYDSEAKNGAVEDITDGRYGLYQTPSNAYEMLSRGFLTKGYVYNEGADNSGITLADSLDAMQSGGAEGGIHGYGKPLRNVYVYDTNKREPEKRVSTGKLNSGTTYFEDSAHVSTAFVRYRNGNCVDAVIYK